MNKEACFVDDYAHGHCQINESIHDITLTCISSSCVCMTGQDRSKLKGTSSAVS
jgi:hypothetical protein